MRDVQPLLDELRNAKNADPVDVNRVEQATRSLVLAQCENVLLARRLVLDTVATLDDGILAIQDMAP